MTQRQWIIALLLAAVAAAAGAYFMLPSNEPARAKQVAAAQAPARFCESHSPASLRALKRGEQRLVIVVKAFQPPKSGDSALVAWLDAGGRRIEITRFGIFPLRAFSAQNPKDAQRFSVPLGDAALHVDETKPLCVEVGFDDAGRGAHGGQAEIELELSGSR